VSGFGRGFRSGAEAQNWAAGFPGRADAKNLPKVSSHSDVDRCHRACVAVLPEKLPGERGPEIVEASIFKGLKTDFLQFIPMAGLRMAVAFAVQSLNPRQGTVDNAGEFGAEFGGAVFEQALLRFRGRKPGGMSIRFLRQLEPSHFAKMSSDGELRLGGSGARRAPAFCSSGVRFPPEVAGERNLLHTAMNAGLLKGLHGSGLGVGQARLNASFGKDPPSAASLNQQKFNAVFADTVTNRSDLLPSLQKPRPLRDFCG
jgi:hypothetical protein